MSQFSKINQSNSCNDLSGVGIDPESFQQHIRKILSANKPQDESPDQDNSSNSNGSNSSRNELLSENWKLSLRRRCSDTYEKIIRKPMSFSSTSTSSPSSSSSSSGSSSPSLNSVAPNDLHSNVNANAFDLNSLSPSITVTNSNLQANNQYYLRQTHKHVSIPSLSIPSFSAPASSNTSPTPISPNTATTTNSKTKSNPSTPHSNINLSQNLNPQAESDTSPQPQKAYEKVLHIFYFFCSAILVFNIFILASKHFFSKIYQWNGDSNSLNSLLLFIYPLHLVFAAGLFFVLILQSKARSLFLNSKLLRLNIYSDISKKLEILTSRANNKQTSSASKAPTLPEVQEIFDFIREPDTVTFSQTLDYIFLGIASSGLINIIMVNTYFNPNEQHFYQDLIFNICSSIEFIIGGILYNIERQSSFPSLQKVSQETHIISQSATILSVVKSCLSKIYLILSLVFFVLVTRFLYDPIAKMLQIQVAQGVDEISFYWFQATLLVAIYSLQVILLTFEYYEQSSYRLATFILSTIFVWLTTFNYDLTAKLFETFSLEQLILRRWIMCVSIAFPCVGLALDYYFDLKKVNLKYSQVLYHIDRILQSDLHLNKRIDSYKQKLRNNNQFLTNTINQYKRVIVLANPMIGFLNDTDIQPQQAPYLHKISKSLEQLSQMSKECLFFSELKALKPSDCERSTFNMETLLEEVISNPTIRNSFEEKELDLCYLLSPNIPLNLIGDSNKLKNILLRLLSNSLKATYQGEIVIRVTLLSEPKPNEDITISFSVIDTGSGIDPENVPFLFDPYAMSESNYDTESLGLGLAICRQLSNLMGGTISYSNAGSEGSLFTLELPFSTQHISKPHSSMKWGLNHKVLIIDDNSNITSAIDMHLDPLGFTVIKAHNISQGISIIKNDKDLSIIFLDAMLPGLNIDEVKQLKFDPVKSTKNPPLVLMCTNKQRKSYSNQGLHFLFKPIKKEQLLTITHSIATSPTNVHIQNSHQSSSSSSSFSTNSSPNTFPNKSSSTPSTPLSKFLYTRNPPSQAARLNGLSTSSSSPSNSSSPTKITLTSVPPLGNSILGTSGSFFSPITPTHSPSASPMTSPILRGRSSNGTANTSPIDNSIFNSNCDQQGMGLIPNNISCGGFDEDIPEPMESSPKPVSPSVSPKLPRQSSPKENTPTSRPLHSVSEAECENEQPLQPQQKMSPEIQTPAPTTSTHKQEFIEQKQPQAQQSTGGIQQQQQPAVNTTPSVNNINILLVEDNPVNARIATTVLQKYSFKVELTSNGQLALERIKQAHSSFDLILMDIHMPVMDGITCARMIRKFESEYSLKQIPIIALTADTSAGHRSVCLEAGCNEFMPKPLDYPILISVLKKLINETEEQTPSDTTSNANQTNSSTPGNSSNSIPATG